ncbi:GAF and ANTAR domain-containing protein [Sinomonas notoginsengisoli]|uniref:ANTAR domain-containing protein n=1 Tax=Sinomonas notoginsengisoli TaxID=1457311 RepID=UPI001F261865|nr:ANTAR domain-containing protein [Sinomonas notoginsengisoli]
MHELVHLLLAVTEPQALLTALTAHTHEHLQRLGASDCALVLRRRNQPALTAGSSPALARVVEKRLADDDDDLATALDRARTAARLGLPSTWASGIAWGAQAGLLVVPANAGPTARAALAIIGRVPADPDHRRALLAGIGRVRNEASGVLRLAVRLADSEEIAQHRALAMQSRTIIDMAVGVIMAQNRCSADEAFDVLRRASNNRNIKLREVAADLVQRVHPNLPQTVFTE